MKIYTEEQVCKAIKLAQECDHECGGVYFDYTETEIIEELTHIELPSDEEIDEYVKSTGYYGHCTHEYHEGIQEGAKWIRDKIQENNK